jgi:hypothetical protein
MDQLTQMEYLQLHELLSGEELALKKCLAYQELMQDDELAPYLSSTIALHRDNIADLVQLMRSHQGKEEVH